MVLNGLIIYNRQKTEIGEKDVIFYTIYQNDHIRKYIKGDQVQNRFSHSHNVFRSDPGNRDVQHPLGFHSRYGSIRL